MSDEPNCRTDNTARLMVERDRLFAELIALQNKLEGLDLAMRIWSAPIPSPPSA